MGKDQILWTSLWINNFDSNNFDWRQSPVSSLVAQSVKNLPAVHETWVRCLGWEDPLEKEMATHSSILAWKTSWTEEPGGLQSMGSQRLRHDWVTNTYLLITSKKQTKIFCLEKKNSILLLVITLKNQKKSKFQEQTRIYSYTLATFSKHTEALPHTHTSKQL